MKGLNLAVLEGLRQESPARFVSLIRLAWPDIKAALDRGHSIKVIHERFIEGGARISYRLFAMYVGQLRRESSEKSPAASSTDFSSEDRLHSNDGERDAVVLVRVPKRRLLSAKAAAQYLGVHEQTLKKITARGELQGRRIGLRLVYCLEDLDRYIESLPLSLGR